MQEIIIVQDDLTSVETRELVTFHHQEMQKNTPIEHVFALDISALMTPNIRIWSAWIDGNLAGICALKQLTETQAELKTMRNHPNYLRQGVAKALLDHIILVAREQNFKKISLETGTHATFDAAIMLYKMRGFKKGKAFSNYIDSIDNQFYHLLLV